MPTLAMCIISPDSMGLPSITSSCLFTFSSWRGISWWRAKSWSINAMPVASQSISICVAISWLFTVNEQVITKCLHSIDPSNTSTLLTDNREIPKHFESIWNKTFSVNPSAILLVLTESFPDSSEPSLVPTSSMSAPEALNGWSFFLAPHSTALWLNPPQYKHLLSANLFAPSSAEILLLPVLRSVGAGAVYRTTV